MLKEDDINEPIKNALSAVSCTSVRHFQERNIFTLCFTDILHHPTSSYIILHHPTSSYIILHHPTSPEACRNMNDNDKCITCSLVLAGSSNSRRSTVQRHVQYSPSMSKVSECKLKRHQLLHGSSNTLPISPLILPTFLRNISKKFTNVPQLDHRRPDSAIPSLDTCQEASLSGPNAIVDRLKWSLNVEVFLSQIPPERHLIFPIPNRSHERSGTKLQTFAHGAQQQDCRRERS